MYIAYVDESGNPGLGSSGSSTYFTLGALLLNADDILDIEKEVARIKIAHEISPQTEFKWNSRYSNFGLDKETFISYRQCIFKLVNRKAVTIVASVLHKEKSYKKPYINNHLELYKQALFLAMERIHYFLEDNEKGQPTIFVIDSRKNNKDGRLDKKLTEAYKRALGQGTYYTNFRWFSETPFFTDSSEAVGIQLADHCVGAIHRVAEQNNDDWYKLIRQSMRHGKNGKIEGYGAKCFP